MQKLLTTLIFFAIVMACESPEDPGTQTPAPNYRDGPYLEITVPDAAGLNPSRATPISTFRWRTIDGADDPERVRWAHVSASDHNDSFDEALDYIRNTPNATEWHPWEKYDPDNQMGTSWTTPPTPYGRYVFAVQGKMTGDTENQDCDLARNARRVLVPSDTYLVVRLTSDFMDEIVSGIINTPPTFVDLPAGTPVEFCWTAYPGHDFDDALVYRYGWDIVDLDDDSQWDVAFTPFDGNVVCSATRMFAPGSRTFLVEVRNASGFITRIPVTIEFAVPAGAQIAR